MNRNVVTLSHLDPELHDWLKQEADRRSKPRNKVSFASLVEIACRRLQTFILENPGVSLSQDGNCLPLLNHGPGFYLKDGQGPFADVQTALEALGIPPEDRPKHNRYDRLSEKLKEQIIKRNNHEEVTHG